MFLEIGELESSEQAGLEFPLDEFGLKHFARVLGFAYDEFPVDAVVTEGGVVEVSPLDFQN